MAEAVATSSAAASAALDAARTRARREVHRRALKAAVKAAEPFGVADAFWGEEVGALVADVQDIFGLTPEQKAALAPAMLDSFADLIARYTPAGQGAAVADLGRTLRSSPFARRAAIAVGRRAAGRLALRLGRVGGIGAAAIARRAWIVPAALGTGTAALYELLGRRCVNQCYAYLRAQQPG